MCCNVCCTKLRLKILVFSQKTYSSISNTVGFLFLQNIIFCSSDIFLLIPMSIEPFNLRIMTSMLFNISSIITKTRVPKKIMENCKKFLKNRGNCNKVLCTFLKIRNLQVTQYIISLD